MNIKTFKIALFEAINWSTQLTKQEYCTVICSDAHKLAVDRISAKYNLDSDNETPKDEILKITKELGHINSINTSYKDAIKALDCLYIAVGKSLADDVKNKVLDTFSKLQFPLFFTKDIKPEQRNENDDKSVNVCIYCPVGDFHTIGYYNYKHEKWVCDDAKPSADFVWNYLDKPNTNLIPTL